MVNCKGEYWVITGEIYRELMGKFLDNYWEYIGELLSNKDNLPIRDIEDCVWANLKFLAYSKFCCLSLNNKKEERDIKWKRSVIKGCSCLCCQQCQLFQV